MGFGVADTFGDPASKERDIQLNNLVLTAVYIICIYYGQEKPKIKKGNRYNFIYGGKCLILILFSGGT